jgi:ribosome biogenesis GTPase A
MLLQWYPGHMTKARRELAELLPSQDLVIEVLDARLPAASTNPVIGELRGATPCIKILAKADLADPAVTTAWLAALARAPHVATLAAAANRPQETRKQLAALAGRLGLKARPDRPIRALIAGVPNVGKSTLINILVDRLVAKTGDRPAVTKAQQRVTLASGMVVTDSPGILWPKIEDEATGLALALAGSIPDTALDYLTIGLYGARLLLDRYAALLAARYKLPAGPLAPDAVLDHIARRRGGLRAGGAVDLHKGAEILVHELRQGTIGRISLEAP